MPRTKGGMTAIVIFAALIPLAGCGKAKDEAATSPPPAKVETISETGLKRVILTDRAAQRIGVETSAATQVLRPGGGMREAVQYASLIYDADGTTLVYTNPEPLVFVRNPVTVDSIQGDLAFLSDGPPVGASVVTVGATELFGIEFGIGEFE